jgi:dihydroorotate dehydrogenase electron transfer subunit
MVKQGIYEVAENRSIAKDVWEMKLIGDTSAVQHPGQFVNIHLDGLYLRRPISVCHWDSDSLSIIYKVMGKGTEKLAEMTGGEKLDLLTGLGNGYTITPARGKKIVLIGGGVGVPPLYALMQRLKAEDVSCVMGFNTSSDVFYVKEFEELGAKVTVTTVDGSVGMKGFVTDALKQMEYDYYFACGPMPMLKAVHCLGGEGQLSFEARMGCGVGVCMSCSCEMLTGRKRICLEGPVFLSSEVKL